MVLSILQPPEFLLSSLYSHKTLCYNHLTTEHSLLSLLGHILLCVIRTASSKWPQRRRQSSINKTESDYEVQEENYLYVSKKKNTKQIYII